MIIFLFVISIIIIILLIWISIKEKKEFKKISNTIDIIIEGNSLIRFKTQEINPKITSLTSKLNQLLNYLNSNHSRIQHLEMIKKQMINDISHDIRTPLSSILGYAEALKAENNLSEIQKQQYLTIIIQRGHQLENLLQDFFEYNQLESGEISFYIEKINLTEIVEEEVLSFYTECKKHNITPYLDIPDLPIYINADSSSIKRILNNLLSNALRYGSSNGKLGVVVRVNQKFASVEVSDNGPGINTDDLPYIFERLFTGEQSRNTSLQGAGLGLAVTKYLVEKHRGNIYVSSLPNKKTSFVFYLPLTM